MDQELKAYFDQHFSDLRREMKDVREQLGEVQETSHQTRILVEDLRGHVCLMAEGMIGFSEQLERHRREIERKIEEVKASIAPAYRDLSDRTTRQYTDLNERVAALEAKAAREHRDVIDVLCEKFGIQRARTAD